MTARVPLLILLLIAGCTTPVAPPAVPSDEPTPPIDAGVDWDDVDLGRVDGEPVPEGSNLALDRITVGCAQGPDPSLDNEDPAAEAQQRWLVGLHTRGWASVTAGVRVFVWDGVLGDASRHALAFRAGVSMAQVPSGQSAEPFGSDEYALTIPVLAELGSAEAIDGTVLPCSDAAGTLSVQAHDVMVCALDARDLDTTVCWFCGDHLGAPAAPSPDTVGRVSYAPGPLGSAFSVTETVQCTYGEARGTSMDRN